MTFTIHTLKTIIAGAALLAASGARALAPDSYATSSVLSSGRWVKIKVTEPGMQQITAAELAEAGFADPARVGVYGFSTVDISDHALTAGRPDDLPQVAAICTDEGKLIFYAEAGERCGVGLNSSGKATPAFRQNPSSREGYYFLHETDSPLRPASAAAEPNGAAPRDSYLTLIMHKYMDRYHTGAGSIILSEDITTMPDKKLTHTFDVVRPDPSHLPTYHISYAAYSSDNDAKISVNYPNSIYTYTFSGTATTLFTRAYTNTATIARLDSDGPVTMTVTARTDNLEFAAVNYAAMLYYRTGEFVAGEPQLSFYTEGAVPAGEQFRFTNTSDAPVEVWDLSTPSAPVRLPVTAGSDATAIAVNQAARPAGSLCRFAAFMPEGELNGVEIIGETANSDLHSLATPDLLIVAIPALMPQAERIADLHRHYQGMDVAVADHLSIFNEFSSGTPSSDAIRRFAKMLYDRNPDKFRHILLLGTSYVNPRGIDTSVVPDISTYIPTFPTEEVAYQFNVAKCYSTDTYFGVLADGALSALTSTMDVNVGRIPASDVGAAEAYIAKAERYLSRPADSDVRSRVLSVCDRGNSSGHTLQAIEAGDLITSLAPDIHIFRAYDPVYDYKNNDPQTHHKVIASHLRTGVGYMSYCGHGNEVTLGSAPLWGCSNIAGTPIDNPPFVMLATCDSYPFDLGVHGIGHSFILSPDGGAIAMIASCREVQMSLNQHLHRTVISAFFDDDAPATFGDVYRRAYNKIKSEGSDNHTVNTLCYAFAGDPALPVYTYTHTLDLDTDRITLTPLSTVNRISGTVSGADGTVDTDFDGTLIADLYTPSYTIKTFSHAASDTLKTVTLDGDLLTTVRARVTAGRFDFNLDMPAVEGATEGYELHMAALRDGSHDRAATTLRDVAVTAASAEPPSTDAPVINDFRFDDTMTLHAEWSASYTLSHRGVTGTSFIEVDGRRTPLLAIASFGGDGTGTLDFTPDELADGHHTARLYLADNAGRTAEARLHFTVMTTQTEAALSVDRPTAVSTVTVDLSHDFTSAPGGRLSIIDRDGQTVLSVADPTFPYVWDCRDGDGERVADGHYTIRAWLTDGRANCEATPTEIVVIQ